MNLKGVTINGYKVTDILGKGTFGVVYKAYKNNIIYALKVFEDYDYYSNQELILQKVISSFTMCAAGVVCMKDYFDIYLDGRKYGCIVLEFMDGTLLDMNIITFGALLKIMADVSFALYSLHLIHITHNDIKPDNILYKHCGTDTIFKLADCGFACDQNYNINYYAYCKNYGTPTYMAPGKIKRMGQPESGERHMQSDVYALGYTFWEMVVAFKNQITVKQAAIMHATQRRFTAEMIETPEFLTTITNEEIASKLNSLLSSMVFVKPEDLPDMNTVYRTILLISQENRYDVAGKTSV